MKTLTLLALGLGLTCLSARATTFIPIPNGDFELPDATNLNPPSEYSNTIDDFSVSGTTASDGTQVNNPSLFATTPDGKQFGYLNTGGGGTTTTIKTSSSLGTIDTSLRYTLSIDVGNRGDTPYADLGNYVLNFYVNGLSVAASDPLAGSSITPGTFQVLSLSYAPVVGEGDPITVGITFTSGLTAGFSQGDVDHFQLSVPEPSTYAMFAGGLLLLVAGFRRRLV